MKRVLIISYDWPPQGSVGMIRPVRFAKYLKRLGHEVSVVTKYDASGRTIIWDIEDREIDALAVRRVRLLPPTGIGACLKDKLNSQFESSFYYGLLDDMDGLIAGTDFDVVISSSPPESAHAIAAEIKRRKKVLWIADLRDLWSDDHYRSFGLVARLLARAEESAILKRADIILTVSDSWGHILRKRYGDRVKVVPNGYDKDYFDQIQLVDSDKFTISYLGKLNGCHQSIANFFIALRTLLLKRSVSPDKIKADFYISGYGKPDISSMARAFGLSGIVTEYATVPFAKALGVIKNSSLLLLVGWKGRSASGWRPQKLCEYLGSGTPILFVNGSENRELGSFLGSIENCKIAERDGDISRQLEFYYDAFKSGRPIRSNRNSDIAAEYTASGMVKRLSDLMEAGDEI